MYPKSFMLGRKHTASWFRVDLLCSSTNSGRSFIERERGKASKAAEKG